MFKQREERSEKVCSLLIGYSDLTTKSAGLYLWSRSQNQYAVLPLQPACETDHYN